MTGAYATNNGLDAVDIGKADMQIPFELGPFDVTVEKALDLSFLEAALKELGPYVPAVK